MGRYQVSRSKVTMFRDLLNRSEAVVMPAAHDAFSAKIIEKAGFEAIFASGGAISASLIGEPDVGLITMTEMVEQNRRIAAAVSIPVFADAEAGYGNPINVMRTVREFENAGVAGLFIEDQEHPIRCGSLTGKRLIPTEEMVKKIEAALEARDNPDFVIAARTDGNAISPEENIKRASAYIGAGVDLIIPHVRGYQDSKFEIELYAREIKGKPLGILFSAVGTHAREMTTFDLARLGYKVIMATGIRDIIPQVSFKLLEQLKRAGTQAAYLEELGVKAPGYEARHGFLGLNKYKELERRFLLKEDRV